MCWHSETIFSVDACNPIRVCFSLILRIKDFNLCCVVFVLQRLSPGDVCIVQIKAPVVVITVHFPG